MQMADRENDTPCWGQSLSQSSGSDPSTAMPPDSKRVLVAQGPSHVFVAEEYPVYVPMLRPSPGLLEILQSVGGKGSYYTHDEILNYLRIYISARQLFVEKNPLEIICANDPLGDVFNLKKFHMKDTNALIMKNCHQTGDSCIKHRVFTRPIPVSSLNVRATDGNKAQPSLSNSGTGSITGSSGSTSPVNSQEEKRDKTRETDQIISSTISETVPTSIAASSGNGQNLGASSSQASATGRKRRASEKSVGESPKRSAKEREGWVNFPWFYQVQVSTDESEILSVQGKETVTVRDSSDDLWFLEEDSGSAGGRNSGVFSIEYEVESDHTEHQSHSDSSSKISGKDVLVVCKDSDMEFWADSSGTNSESDRELKEDSWSCQECDTQNPPVQRYCLRCWKLRPGWLPDQVCRKRSFKAKASKYQKGASNIDDLSSDSDGETGLIRPKSSTKRAANNDSLPKTDREVSATVTIPKSPDMMRRTFLNYQTVETKPSQECSQKDAKPDELDSSKSKTEESDLNTSNLSLPSSASIFSSQPSSSNADCIICFSKPKTASLIHGGTGHQVCCFKCAKRLKRRHEPCPVCRKPIQKVIRNYVL